MMAKVVYEYYYTCRAPALTCIFPTAESAEERAGRSSASLEEKRGKYEVFVTKTSFYFDDRTGLLTTHRVSSASGDGFVANAGLIARLCK